ncbi:type II methionyl aminopeptidase [Ignicoccus hospitalis]|uniref:Methionine aminopeptidase n=1 Tax=Ignicoccus hospitalis (strain KIN4/I / DSM 18386 / JCM 14125) TaxID=453591 RepID=A8A976_IGNH4|nr:type II methionyl aminopeptidase [Ignicoccus hospitalis]ABU81478.1 methionine aminopeptidase, type II [Ignicoccus hospitalis KIN4/I]
MRSGEAVRRALERGRELIRPGASVLEICEEVEDLIRKLSDGPAFPCNLSVGYEAAHYSPVPEDPKRLPEKGIVKLDLGAHVRGRIADSAISVLLKPVEKHEKLSEAVKEALERALERARPGLSVSAIGTTISVTIRRKGFKPISNLGGHGLAPYLVHSGVSIPNVPEPLPFKLEPGRAYAIEPFGTDGAGYVVEGKEVTIFSLRPRPPKGWEKRAGDLKDLVEVINERFKTLPFSPRWLTDVMAYDKLMEALLRLSKIGVLTAYPILIEAKRGEVAQWEHTIFVTEEGVVVTTAGSNRGSPRSSSS